MKKSWIVGSGPECDIVVDSPIVSRTHCQFIQTKDGFQLLDLRSEQGTFVNGRRVLEPVIVGPSDAITLGQKHRLRWPFAKTPAVTEALPVPPLEVGMGQVVIGRDDDCDVVLDSSQVSRKHARVRGTASGLMLEDLGSRNGTLLNGQPVASTSIIKPGDLVSVGEFNFEVTRDGRLKRQESFGLLTVEARNVTVDVPGQRLLDDVSLTIYPAELVGLMGPSGAGKTTLMSALNGYLPPTAGWVLYNGRDAYAEYAHFSALLGYVPQDDIMHRELTVERALYFTARLRLPPETSNEEIQSRIERVLKQLAIEETRNIQVGSPERRGISGGQRKRVNLAMELLTDPAVLFLDEPTSGLSSEDALAVIKLLRELANSGKSVLLTIHQPALELFRLLDAVVVLSKDSQSQQGGKLVYFGPAYPDAVRFFNPESPTQGGAVLTPEDMLRGMSRRSTRQWHEQYEASPAKQQYVTSRAGRLKSPPDAGPPKVRRDPGLSQLMTLIQRTVAIKAADRWNTTILLAQAPIIALLVCLVFGQQSRQTITADNWRQVTTATAVSLFLLALSALWFGCSNAARDIVGEWAVYRRERMVNLQLPAYVMSKVIVSCGLCTFQCLVLVIVARFGCGMRGPLVSTFLVFMLISGCGVGLGLIVSAFARTSEIAIALLPLVLIPMVIFGGTMLPVYKMQAFIRPAAYIIPSRYGFEALIEQEAARRPLGPSIYSATIVEAHGDGDVDRPDMAENYFPRGQRLGLTKSVGMLAAIFVLTVIVVHLILRFRDLH